MDDSGMQYRYGNPKEIPKGHKLGDYIKHEALFEAYSELKNTTLQFAAMDTGTQGRWRSSWKQANGPERNLR